MTDHYVYTITCNPEGKFARNCHRHFYVKVGVTTDVDKRLTGLQTGNPMRLKVLAVTNPISRAKAYDLEAHIHHQLQDWRSSGEWFDFNAHRGRLGNKNKMTIVRLNGIVDSFLNAEKINSFKRLSNHEMDSDAWRSRQAGKPERVLVRLQ